MDTKGFTTNADGYPCHGFGASQTYGAGLRQLMEFQPSHIKKIYRIKRKYVFLYFVFLSSSHYKTSLSPLSFCEYLSCSSFFVIVGGLFLNNGSEYVHSLLGFLLSLGIQLLKRRFWISLTGLTPQHCCQYQAKT